jgi:hypothetical protein
MVEPLAERTRDLYADAELRLLGIIARQLADGLDAPGWAERKLSAGPPRSRPSTPAAFRYLAWSEASSGV